VVQVFDTTLRDGEQSPGCLLSGAAKTAIAAELAGLGIDVIEAGFPAAGPAEWAAVEAVARQFSGGGPTICAMARANAADTGAGARAVRPAARPRIPTSPAPPDPPLAHKLRLTRRQARRTVGAMVRRARNVVDEIQFSPEDATRTEPAFLFEVLDTAVEA